MEAKGRRESVRHEVKGWTSDSSQEKQRGLNESLCAAGLKERESMLSEIIMINQRFKRMKKTTKGEEKSKPPSVPVENGLTH